MFPSIFCHIYFTFSKNVDKKCTEIYKHIRKKEFQEHLILSIDKQRCATLRKPSS
jgi:hypothetical protein